MQEYRNILLINHEFINIFNLLNFPINFELLINLAILKFLIKKQKN